VAVPGHRLQPALRPPDRAHGELTAPVQVLVNGRITAALGDHVIPVADIVTAAARDHLAQALPLLDVNRWVDVRPRLTQASSPGAVHTPAASQREASRQRWFAPRSLDDLAERHRMFSNDSSVGVAYWPLWEPANSSPSALNPTSRARRSAPNTPTYGTDIKLMVVRHGARVQLTACVPQIARETADLDTYIARRTQARDLITELASTIAPEHHVTVAVNTRDVDTRPELYLTATGSSIESGDEGVVGRGNRANGLIRESWPRHERARHRRRHRAVRALPQPGHPHRPPARPRPRAARGPRPRTRTRRRLAGQGRRRRRSRAPPPAPARLRPVHL
jgi:S-adenosylmethionine synthetase